MTVVSINQPAYLPWDGYFDRIRQSDLHIVLDHVQFEKGSATNRCLIRQRDGRTMWLTVPVEKGKPINRTRAVGNEWKRKHERSLMETYRFGYKPRGHYLHDIASHSFLLLALSLLDHIPAMATSTALGGSKLGTKSGLVLNLCKEVGADVYLSGPHGRDYLDLPSFDKAGIEVRWFEYPPGPQLSALDGLFRAKVAA